MQQFIHQHEHRAIGQHLADHVAGGCDPLRIVLRNDGQSLLAAQLPGHFGPGRLAYRLTVAAAAAEHVEFGPHDHGHGGPRDGVQAGSAQNAGHTLPRLGLVAVLGQMVERRQRVRLAAAELRRHVEYGGSFKLDARQPPQHLARQVGQAPRHVRAIEKASRLNIVNMCPRTSVPDVIQMDGELRGVERAVVPQILAGRDDLIPGLQFSHVHPSLIRKPVSWTILKSIYAAPGDNGTTRSRASSAAYAIEASMSSPASDG